MVCGNHLRQLNRVYHGWLPRWGKRVRFNSVLEGTELCPRCLSLRRRSVKSSPEPGRPAFPEVPLVERWDYDAIEFHTSVENRRNEFERAGLFPAPHVLPEVADRLYALGSTEEGRWPASALLSDGTEVARVVFITEEYVFRWHPAFWLQFVRASKVVEVSPSPDQIPLPVARQLSNVGETSMSSLEFVLAMKDGSELAAWYSYYNDFVELPKPFTPADIQSVRIGRGIAHNRETLLPQPDFVWCVSRL